PPGRKPIVGRMKSAPYVRGGRAARLASLVAGLALFSFGIVLTLESRLGLSPWDVLNQGIARNTPLSFGEANILVALGALVAGWLLGGTVGVGTLAFAILVGPAVEASFWLLRRSSLAVSPGDRAVSALAETALSGVRLRRRLLRRRPRAGGGTI